MDRQSFSDLQSFDEHANELLTRPLPLSYKQLARGALYNAAQPKRQERVSACSDTPEPFDSSLDQVSVTAHEDDPPVWPSRGLPFRLERPPSPPLATKRSPATPYVGWRPSHATVAAGALYNPYVRARLPDNLAPRPLPRSTTKASHVHESRVSRNTSDVSASKNKRPQESLHDDIRYPIPRTTVNPGLFLEVEDVRVHPGYKNSPRSSRSRRLSDESFLNRRSASPKDEPLNHPPTPGGGSVRASPSQPPSTAVREAPWVQHEQPTPAAFDSVHPSRARTISDDTIYYHPSREGTIREPPSLHQEPARNVGSHHPSRAPSFSGGGLQHFGTGSIHGPSSLHHELANGVGSHHPSRAPSVNGGGSQHFDGAMLGGPPSLHRHNSLGSHHPSRPPSVNGGGSQHFGDGSSMHPSQIPTVIRDSVFKDEDWGLGAGGHDFHENEGWGGAEGGFVEEHSHGQHLSRASTIKGGSVKGADSIRDFNPSRAPSVAATHVSRFQDQNGSIHRVPSRAPSAASHRMSQIQHHVGGSRTGTPFRPPHETVYEEDFEHQHFEQERAMIPGAASFHGSRPPSVLVEDDFNHSVHPSRSPSAPNDAASVHSRAPSVAPNGGVHHSHPPSVHAAGIPSPSIHPSHAPSAMNDAASIRSRAPSVAKNASVHPSRAPSAAGISRAPSALTVHGGASPTPTLMRRGRMSVMGRNSGRATPVIAASASDDVYHISVVQATPTDAGSHKGAD